MNKTVAFFVFVFLCGSLLSVLSEGKEGVATTTLSANITSTATTIPVVGVLNRKGNGLLFLEQDKLIIDDEVIEYSTGNVYSGLSGRACPDTSITTACFYNVTRGENKTDPIDHTSGTIVFNEITGVVEVMTNFNLAEELSGAGIIKAPVIVPLAMATALPKMLVWDYSYLQNEYVYLKYILLYPMSAGFVWSMVILLIPLFRGLFLR